jgi:hypothetical protein
VLYFFESKWLEYNTGINENKKIKQIKYGF